MKKSILGNCLLVAASILLALGVGAVHASTLGEAMKNVKIIAYPANGKEVDYTVSTAIMRELAPQARVVKYQNAASLDKTGMFVVSVADENFAPVPTKDELKTTDPDWMYFKIGKDGSGELVVSSEHLLYATYCQVKLWRNENIDKFVNGKTMTPAFTWLRNYSDFLVGTRRYSRGFVPAEYVKQAASEGFSHITVNGLGVPHPFDEGPPGDKYSEFYDYTPDLDQFVSSKLLKGYYPPYYLTANLNFLKRNAKLAKEYGMAPGLVICSPRTMPKDFWNKYPFLRGARVDHPRESYEPRYTLTLEHPAVQESYRELVANLMKAVPDLSFIEIWSNDSGSGFEFANRLYPGRNGGPYLVREWKSDDYVAQKMAANVVNYYHLILNEARKFNPKFRVIVDLGSFTPLELKYIIPALGKDLDVGDWSGQWQDQFSFNDKWQKEWEKEGSQTQLYLSAANDNSIGVPFPKVVYDELAQAYKGDYRYILSETIPTSLVPYDINGQVVRAFQMDHDQSLNQILENVADRWVGKDDAATLIDAWMSADSAVSGFPAGVPNSTFGFPWYRMWVRPFVPNIGAIPQKERAYYEKFMLTTFNNPTRVDFNNDMLWNFLTVEQAAEKRKGFDEHVMPQIDRSIRLVKSELARIPRSSRADTVFTDLLANLETYRCYSVTMRDMVAWIEGVHGYLEAKTPEAKAEYRARVKSCVEMEIQNTKDLLKLWNTSPVEIMGVSTVGENMNTYGENFGHLLEKRLSLMEQHVNDVPYIDPNYMWRMPEHYPPINE